MEDYKPFIPYINWLKYLYENIENGLSVKLVGSEKNGIATTPFNELLTVEKTTKIEIKSIYGISQLRDDINVSGNGSVTNDFREYILNVNSVGDFARLSSRDRGRYIAGKSSEYGIGVRTENETVTGDTVLKWGALNNINGIYFGMDSIGLFVAVLDNTVETKIYQTDWNLDKMDGSDLSELNLNNIGTTGTNISTNDGLIYQIEYTWYGYGTITFKIQTKTLNGMKTIPVHRYIVNGKTSIENPNLPLTVLVEQTNSANNVNLFIAGRQFSILGSYTPTFRQTSQVRIAQSIPIIGPTMTPIISFKQKNTMLFVNAIFDGVEISTNNKIIFEVYIADLASLTNPVWTTPIRIKASETAFEMDISATVFNSALGELIYRGVVIGASGNNLNSADFGNLNLDIPEGKILVLCAFATNNQATVDSILRIREEW
jgi:hypothetical protein